MAHAARMKESANMEIAKAISIESFKWIFLDRHAAG